MCPNISILKKKSKVAVQGYSCFVFIFFNFLIACTLQHQTSTMFLEYIVDQNKKQKQQHI